MGKSKTKSQRGSPSSDLENPAARFVVRWNQLTSATNWEKGRIIFQWRQSLLATAANRSAYSDDAWSRSVGHVTSQHVGRLRRVYERFGSVRKDYDGLYWSHFQCALEWTDAEMWLEGALRNGWSVSQMRAARWEAHGAPADLKPRESDIITAEIDEDDSTAWEKGTPATITPSLSTVRDPGTPYPHGLGTRDESSVSDFLPFDEGTSRDSDSATKAVSPQAAIEEADLPRDLTKVFASLAKVIDRHIDDGRDRASKRDVLAVLDSLKKLVRSS